MKFFSARSMHRWWSVIAAGCLLCAAADAHHSFGQFDVSKTLTVHGTVTEWLWANPHSWLHVDVVKPDGTVEQWGFEFGSPNMLERWGWHPHDVKAGDKVTLDVHPSREGKHIGSAQAIFLPSGKVLGDPMGQAKQVEGDELASGPSALPTKPQGEEYR